MALYAVIPAGGSGTRLWPLSRSSYPKHLLDLNGQGSMIQQTVQRVLKVAHLEHVLVISEQSHAAEIHKQLPALPSANIIIEPERRDTAPVIGLGAVYACARDPEAIIASFHADHIIRNTGEFAQVIRAARQIAEQQDVIVTIGIHPTCPSTGYGYIASGQEFARTGNLRVFRVHSFTEKPNLPTARAFLASGNFFWNAGMFIAKATVLMQAYKQYVPKTYAGLQKIAAAIGKPEESSVLMKTYPSLAKEPIDTAIMEKSDQAVVIPADIGWSDIGSWAEVKSMVPANQGTNLVLGQHVGLDTEETIIYSSGSRLITTIGLRDMVIVDTEDVLLICPRERSEEVKALVDKLKKEKRDSYL